MDTGSVIIALLIVVWGALEYQRRERTHKMLLAWLERSHYGPSLASSPAAWKIIGEGLVAILLAAGSALMFSAAVRGGFSGPVLYGMGILFSAMMVILVLMIVRDARQRTPSSSISQAEKP